MVNETVSFAVESSISPFQVLCTVNDRYTNAAARAALLKQMLNAAADWGYLAAAPLGKVRKLRVPRRALLVWTPVELRRFLLSAPEAWRPVFIVAVFAGLRPGEIQAMRWQGTNWPDFTANKIHVTTSYEARSKVLGAPKTDRSVRDVDIVPTVRQALEVLSSRAVGGLVFPRTDGAIFSRDTMRQVWVRTINAASVRPLRPYDLRHTYASLLTAAGKNPLYVTRQMGHYSAGFTLDTYGHLIELLPKRQVEWIDELVFPEGYAVALNLHLSDALRSAAPCHPVQPSKALEPRQKYLPAIPCSRVQRDAWCPERDLNPRYRLEGPMS